MSDDNQEGAMAEVVPFSSEARHVVGNPKFDAQLARMAAIHGKKAHDYAQSGNPYSNFEYAATVADRFTDPVDRVFATLLGIKLARIAELKSAGKSPRNESVRDSFDDLATYAALWASYGS